jgi:5-methylthioadenosine/S-adenosylhomocysteine deaminase
MMAQIRPERATMTRIANASWVVAWDTAARRHVYRRDQDIEITDGAIRSIGPARGGPLGDGIDGRDLLVMPGLINIHSHPTTEPAYRGVREDHGVPEQQMTGLFERSQAFRLEPDGRRAAVELAYAEMLGCGTTTVVDLSSPLDGWVEVMRRSGLRVYVGAGFADARWRMSAPQTVEWEWDEANGRQAFRRAQAVMAEAEAEPSGRLKGIVFPAQIDTVTPGLFRDARDYARDTRRPFTTHIAQAVVEVREMIRRHGVTPIQWAAEHQLLGPGTILGHSIFLDEHPQIGWHTRRDLGLIADSGAAVAHCPSPFARYGVTLCDFGRYVDRGVTIGIGTDVAPHNLIEEMRLAVLLGRVAGEDIRSVDTARVFHAATIGGATALGRDDLGRIAPGARADLVLVDLKHPSMLPARDPVRAMLFHAADRAVKRVLIDGETVLDGKPVGLDPIDAGGRLTEAQARMLRDAGQNDYRGRNGDVLVPLSLPVA